MILRVGLANFKCFENQSLPLAPVTLLTGLNGMGKSSVLQALLLLRQSHEQGLLQSAGLALNGTLTRVGTAVDALYERAKTAEIGFARTLRHGTNVEWRFKYERQAELF